MYISDLRAAVSRIWNAFCKRSVNERGVVMPIRTDNIIQMTNFAIDVNSFGRNEVSQFVDETKKKHI